MIEKALQQGQPPLDLFGTTGGQGKLYVGIDPGGTGGIATLTQSGELKYWSVPQVKTKVDYAALAELIKSVSEGVAMCGIEDVHSIFGSSAKSNFSFGYTCGFMRGLIIATGMPYEAIQPKKWQGEIWGNGDIVKINTGKKSKNGNPLYKVDTKASSLLAAKRLFPGKSFFATSRSSTPHNGIVDAVLIAEYCRRKF